MATHYRLLTTAKDNFASFASVSLNFAIGSRTLVSDPERLFWTVANY
ncbi:MAG: hypothetical protein ACI9FR_002311 [Cryomorphaceae bacterium]|jgi:hypothetical protein